MRMARLLGLLLVRIVSLEQIAFRQSLLLTPGLPEYSRRMGNRGSRSRYYALVFITTVLVVVVPAVVVYVLRVNNVVTGFWACLGLAVGLALVASFGT